MPRDESQFLWPTVTRRAQVEYSMRLDRRRRSLKNLRIMGYSVETLFQRRVSLRAKLQQFPEPTLSDSLPDSTQFREARPKIVLNQSGLALLLLLAHEFLRTRADASWTGTDEFHHIAEELSSFGGQISASTRVKSVGGRIKQVTAKRH